MTITAWLNQFVSFSSTDGFVLDLLTSAVVCIAVATAFGFIVSLVSSVFTR